MPKNQLMVALAAVLSFAALPAAAAIDLTAVEAALADLPTVVTTIGTALIGAAALAVAFKWAKGALFG